MSNTAVTTNPRRVAMIGILLTFVLMIPATEAEASLEDSFMRCYEGSGMVTFSVPITGKQQWTYFYMWTQQTGWQMSNLYYSDGIAYLMHDGTSWQSLGAGFGPSFKVGNGQTVYGGEWRYTTAEGWVWKWFPTCRTSSFYEPYITYTH